MCYKLIIICEQCTGHLIEFMEGVVVRFKPGKMHMYPASEVVLNLRPIIFNSIQWTSTTLAAGKLSLVIYKPVHLAFSLRQDKSNQLLFQAMNLGRAL